MYVVFSRVLLVICTCLILMLLQFGVVAALFCFAFECSYAIHVLALLFIPLCTAIRIYIHANSRTMLILEGLLTFFSILPFFLFFFFLFFFFFGGGGGVIMRK